MKRRQFLAGVAATFAPVPEPVRTLENDFIYIQHIDDQQFTIHGSLVAYFPLENL